MATLAYTNSTLNSVWKSTKHSPLPSELFTTIKSLNICQVSHTVRGCRAGTKRGRSIAVITTLRSGSCTYQHKQASGLGVNKNNLVRIKCNYVHVQPLKKSLQICCLNPRSIKNKALSLSDYIVTQDYDIVALTETWLGTSVDKKCIAELVPSGYNMKHVPRPGSRKGGGVALLYKSTISFRYPTVF